MSRERPADAVTRMDPELIRQEGESLAPLVTAFRAGGYLPFLTLSSCRKRSGHQEGRRDDSAERSCSSPHSLLRLGMNRVRFHARVKTKLRISDMWPSPDGSFHTLYRRVRMRERV